MTGATESRPTDPFADVEPLLEHEIAIASPVEAVWSLVRDPRHLARWSPTLESTVLRDADEPGLGVRFTNRNRDGELAWVTHGEIVRYDAPQGLAFRIEENWAIWSFDLQSTDAGTRVTHRRLAPEGVSAYSRRLTDTYMGGQRAFTALLRTGMAQTLEALKADAETATS